MCGEWKVEKFNRSHSKEVDQVKELDQFQNTSVYR